MERKQNETHRVRVVRGWYNLSIKEDGQQLDNKIQVEKCENLLPTLFAKFGCN